jgi:hypothetical protein
MRFDLQERVAVHIQSGENMDSRFRGNDEVGQFLGYFLLTQAILDL